MIRLLDKADAPIYQQLRLRALKINPEAFASTYEKEVQFSIETVQERLKPTSGKFVLGAFLDHNSLVGTVSLVREEGIKTSHKGNVFGMFVAPEARGESVGKSLMTALINEAKKCAGLEQLNLMVSVENKGAKSLYESVGFEVYGMERNSLKYNGRYYDEYLMNLKF